MDVKIIAGIVLTAVIAIALFYSGIKEAMKSPDQRYKEKQERLKKNSQNYRDAMTKIINLHPGLRAIEKEIDAAHARAKKRMENDPWTQEFLLKRTADELFKKRKQTLINIAKKDLGIELDPKMTKLEMVNKIYVKYHNLKGWDWVLKKDFKK